MEEDNLDGSRSPFDQVKAISDAVGDKLEIILDGGSKKRDTRIKSHCSWCKSL